MTLIRLKRKILRKERKKMELIVEIVHFILDRFNTCLEEVLQVFEEILEEKENKVIKKNFKKGE